MFQVELNTMVRQEQLRDLVRDAARREAKRQVRQNVGDAMLGRVLMAVPLCIAIVGVFVSYLV